MTDQEHLASLGFDSEATYDVPENPADAALAGVAAFVREHSLEQEPTSSVAFSNDWEVVE